ncbi:hypothetical protein BDV59DRAFT_177150 [Aspergillus ambiguus]|uniref:uncharacterized protein n=1 Tax=Aspergillus ambiguus TaxID=176160 RepID=UPI003CCCC1B7
MDKQPTIDIPMRELPPSSILPSLIPISIKQRIPVLLHWSLQRLPIGSIAPPQSRMSLKYLTSNNSLSPGMAEGDHPQPAGDTTFDTESVASSIASNNGGVSLEMLPPDTVRTVFDGEGSGIDWARVVDAMHLFHASMLEARKDDRDNRTVRSLYIDATGHILDCLPPGLDQNELARIRSHFPDQLELGQMEPARDRPPRSAVYRLIASGIICLFIAMRFLAPYIKGVMNGLYRYERAYRVTERVTAGTLNVAHNVGVAILDRDQPKAFLADLVTWGVENIGAGVYEGVKEGLSVTGMNQPVFWAELVAGAVPER